MSNKRELHTLFIKHDTDFKTLSKKALSEVILKIILFQNGKTGLIQIKSGLNSLTLLTKFCKLSPLFQHSIILLASICFPCSWVGVVGLSLYSAKIR